jgi:DNA-binding response OmpR family regulator
MTEVPGFQNSDPRPRLLVVDDDDSLRVGLRDILGLMGYRVEEAASGDEALKLLESMSCDLMILDVRMPGMSGVEVMRRARRLDPHLSIIVLTGYASLDSAIAAVKNDAVDYMLKPPDVEDLATTVSRALKERADEIRHQQLLDLIGEAIDTLDQDKEPVEPPSSSSVSPSPPMRPQRFLYAGPLTLDCHKRLAIVQGDPPVELTESEAAVLAVLMAEPNKVFSWSELAYAAMNYTLDEQDAQNQVRLYVFRLRRKIETDQSKPRFIRTVRGRGYFLCPE